MKQKTLRIEKRAHKKLVAYKKKLKKEHPELKMNTSVAIEDAIDKTGGRAHG